MNYKTHIKLHVLENMIKIMQSLCFGLTHKLTMCHGRIQGVQWYIFTNSWK